jgi:hypothetical protein
MSNVEMKKTELPPLKNCKNLKYFLWETSLPSGGKMEEIVCRLDHYHVQMMTPNANAYGISRDAYIIEVQEELRLRFRAWAYADVKKAFILLDATLRQCLIPDAIWQQVSRALLQMATTLEAASIEKF